MALRATIFKVHQRTISRVLSFELAILFNRMRTALLYAIVLVLVNSNLPCHGLNTSTLFASAGAGSTSKSDYVCFHCRHGVMNLGDVMFIPSTLSARTFNHTVTGVGRKLMLQHFVNPQDHSFDLVTVSKANVAGNGRFYEEHSWWPVYLWQIAVCPHCRRHIGWIFEQAVSDEDAIERFYGLIFSQLSHNATGDTAAYMTRNDLL